MVSETPAEILSLFENGRITPGPMTIWWFSARRVWWRRPSWLARLYFMGGVRTMSGSKMSAEIHERPEVLERILDEEWDEVLSASRVLRQGDLRFVMIAARGTSDNAALYAKYLFEVLLGVRTVLASPSAFTLYESRMNLEGVLVVGISQSGESQDVLEILRRSGELGANTLTVTNDEGSAMAKVGQHHFFLRAGKEESVAATKTYTAELMMLYLLVSAL
jgi:glutamine---fructose-6-phosphate transaminase (isomerizing)